MLQGATAKGRVLEGAEQGGGGARLGTEVLWPLLAVELRVGGRVLLVFLHNVFNLGFFFWVFTSSNLVYA